jgi:hypothetical protein
MLRVPKNALNGPVRHLKLHQEYAQTDFSSLRVFRFDLTHAKVAPTVAYSHRVPGLP